MPRYDDTFVDRFLEPWNRHDVDGALAVMTDDCVWEVTRGREPHGTLYTGRAAVTACRRAGKPIDGASGAGAIGETLTGWVPSM